MLATNPDLIMLEVLHARLGGDGRRTSTRPATRAPSSRRASRSTRSSSRARGRRWRRAIWNMDRAPLFDSPAYKEFLAAVPGGDAGPYAPQAWDQMSMVALALVAGKGEVSGTVIKDHLRTVSNPPGTAVYSFAEGAKLLARGQEDQLRGRVGLVRLRRDRRHPVGAVHRAAGAPGQERACDDRQPLIGPGMPPIAQYVFNGFVTGGILALPAIAFTLLWRLLRFPNFAVSTYLTVGAYVALVLNQSARLPLELAWLGALAGTGRGGPRRRSCGVPAHARPAALLAGHRLDRRGVRPGEHRPLHLEQRLSQLRRPGDARHDRGRPARRPRAARSSSASRWY